MNELAKFTIDALMSIRVYEYEKGTCGEEFLEILKKSHLAIEWVVKMAEIETQLDKQDNQNGQK